MTTIDRAAASSVRLRTTQAALLVIACFGLSGCETGGGLFAGQSAPEQAAVADAAQQQTKRAKIAIAPIVGPPDATSQALQAQVTAGLERQGVSVAKQSTDPSDYTLRGYVVAAKEKASTKVSYIWDVTDPTGKRVNRITGEEVAPGGASKDTWSSVTPQIVDQIASKTSNSIATWLPTQTAQGGVPMASAATPPASGSTAASQATAMTPAAPAAQGIGAASTTGSIARSGPILASVPSVTGAPGDGSAALTRAIQNELTKNGVALANGSPDAYKVEGKVSVGAAKDGKQPVAIDWHVKDAQGKHLGTVSQKNEVPQGSLDGSWGKTADAAAAAAAQGIVKLLPKAN